MPELGRIYFSKEDFYQNAPHPYSSAGMDIVFNVYEEISPTIFSQLTMPEKMIINEILSNRETYKSQLRMLKEKRDSLNFENFAENIRSINQSVEFLIPSGPVISLGSFLEKENSSKVELAKMLIVPVSQEVLENQKQRELEESNSNVEHFIKASLLWFKDSPSSKFWAWYRKRMQSDKPGFILEVDQIQA